MCVVGGAAAELARVTRFEDHRPKRLGLVDVEVLIGQLTKVSRVAGHDALLPVRGGSLDHIPPSA
jgi:hypothetical protein